MARFCEEMKERRGGRRGGEKVRSDDQYEPAGIRAQVEEVVGGVVVNAEARITSLRGGVCEGRYRCRVMIMRRVQERIESPGQLSCDC